jgi:hypothetical protein
VVWSIAIAILVAHAHAAGAVGHIDQEDRYVRIGINFRRGPRQVDADCGPRRQTGQDPDWSACTSTPPRTPAQTAPKQTSTWSPQWTDLERRPARVSAGQAPYDVARPKGLEPLTF